MNWFSTRHGLKDERLTYRSCVKLWSGKSPRLKYRRLNARVRLRQEGENFVLTDRTGGVSYLTVRPDNTAVIHLENARHHLGPQSTPYHYRTYAGLFTGRKKDPYISQVWWIWTRGEKGTLRKLPLQDGTVVNMVSGQVVSELPTYKARRVRRKEAKEVAASIQAWEKLARSYFAVVEPEVLLEAYRGAKSKHPAIGAEPTTKAILALTKSHLGTPWWFSYRGASWRTPEWMAGRVKAAFTGAVRKWRHRLYEEHGVYEWRPVDKQAA